MQTSLDSSGQPGGQMSGQPVTDQLERRLDVAVPLAQIDGEVEKRLARLAQDGKGRGISSRQGADQDGRAAVRIAGAVGRHFRRRPAGFLRRGACAEPARCGLPAHRTQDLGSPAANALQFSAVFEIYPDVALGDVATLNIDRPAVEVTAEDVDRTLEVLRMQRAAFAPATRPADDGDRLVVDFSGHDRRSTVCRRPGTGLFDHHRRRPHAARVRRCTRGGRRRGSAGDSVDVSCRLSRQGSRGKVAHFVVT